MVREGLGSLADQWAVFQPKAAFWCELDYIHAVLEETFPTLIDKGGVKENILRRAGLLFHRIQTTRTMAPFNAAPLKSALFSFQIRHIAFWGCARLNLTVENAMFYACSVNNWGSDLHLILEKMPFNAFQKSLCFKHV